MDQSEVKLQGKEMNEIPLICDDLWRMMTKSFGGQVLHVTIASWKEIVQEWKVYLNDNESSILLKMFKDKYDQETYKIFYDDWVVAISKLWFRDKLQRIYHEENMNMLKKLYFSLSANIDRDNIRMSYNSWKAICCYQWRLPKHKPSQIELLCAAYMRQESSMFIPHEIIKICLSYFGVDIQGIFHLYRNATKGQYFTSGIIEYQSCLFVIKFYPFGKEKDDDQVGDGHNNSNQQQKSTSYEWYIEWLGGPSNIYSCSMDCSLHLMEKWLRINRTYLGFLYHGQSKLLNRNSQSLQINDIEYLNSLTFNLFIHEFNAFDYNQNPAISDKPKGIKVSSPILINETMFESNTASTYKWHFSQKELIQIKNAEPKDIVKSDIFIMHRLKWQMYLIPNGDNEAQRGQCQVLLFLIGFPVKIEKIVIYFQTVLSDTSKPFTISFEATEEDPFCYLIPRDMLERNELLEYNNPSFTINTLLLSIIDKDGNNWNVNQLPIPNPTDDFLKLCPRKSYEWKVSNSVLQKMKTCSSTQSFFSPLFKMFGVVFALECYPKRRIDFNCDDFTQETTACTVQIHLIKLPANIGRFTMNEYRSLVELNIKFPWITEFGCNKAMATGSWDEDLVFWKDIENLNTMTFCCDLQLLNVLDKSGINITKQMIEQYKDEDVLIMDKKTLSLPNAQYFTWKVTRDFYAENRLKCGNVLTSEIFEIFGLKWYMWFLPKYERNWEYMNMYICRADFPPNIATITVQCKVCINEIEFVTSGSAKLDHDETSCVFENFLEQKEIENFGHISFKVQMILFDVTDKDGNDITNKYINLEDDEMKNEQEEQKKLHNKPYYLWEILCFDLKRKLSPFFRMKDIESEFQLEINPRNRHDEMEIFVIIKSLPNDVDRLCLMCTIRLINPRSGEAVVVCGAIHFIAKKKLKCKLIDVMELEDYDEQPWNIIIELQTIASYNTIL